MVRSCRRRLSGWWCSESAARRSPAQLTELSWESFAARLPGDPPFVVHGAELVEGQVVKLFVPGGRAEAEAELVKRAVSVRPAGLDPGVVRARREAALAGLAAADG